MLNLLFVSLASLLVAASTAPVDKDCPTGLTSQFTRILKFEDKCYATDFKRTLDRDHAEAFCQKDGGFLASPKDPFENKFLQDKFKHDPFWIGLRMYHRTNQTLWQDGSRLFYKNWWRGATYNYEDNCYYMDDYGTWLFTECDKVLPFVCQYPTTSSKSEATTGDEKQTSTHSKSDCPIGATQGDVYGVYGDKCYSVSKHWLGSWSDSSQRCQASGGYLAEIKSEALAVFLHSMLFDKDLITFYQYWVGLTYDATVDQFLWGDGTPLGAYPRLPKNEMTGSSACAAIDMHFGVWTVSKCNYFASRFICEYNLVSGKGQSTEATISL